LEKDLELLDSGDKSMKEEEYMSDRRAIFHLQPDVYDLLNQAALERGLSIDEFVELLIERYLIDEEFLDLD